MPVSVFDTAVQAGLIALPQEDATISTLTTTSSTTHASGSEAAVATVVTADNHNSTRIADAGQTHNNRLANVGWMWAFTAASTYEPARQHYRRRREHGDRHAAANRHLFNRLLGQLHHCLQHREPFDDVKAFAVAVTAAA